jgi:hypothetical protein
MFPVLRGIHDQLILPLAGIFDRNRSVLSCYMLKGNADPDSTHQGYSCALDPVSILISNTNRKRILNNLRTLCETECSVDARCIRMVVVVEPQELSREPDLQIIP